MNSVKGMLHVWLGEVIVVTVKNKMEQNLICSSSYE